MKVISLPPQIRFPVNFPEIVARGIRRSNLVLGGGGVRAIAFVGAYLTLRNAGVFDRPSSPGRPGAQPQRPSRIHATSGGFPLGVPIALGASDDLLLEIAHTMPYDSFDDDSSFFPVDMYRFIRHYGTRKGNAISEWVRELVGDLTGKPDMTLGQVQAHSGCELSAVTVDVDRGKVVILSPRATPDLEVWRAARRTTSIPFFFTALRDDDELNHVDELRNMLVDGGLLNNYDIRYFDTATNKANVASGGRAFGFIPPGSVPTPTPRRGALEIAGFNTETVGIRVGDRIEHDHLDAETAQFDEPCKNVVNFATRCFRLLYSHVQNRHLDEDDWNRTVWCDGLGIPATKFKLDKDEVTALLESGMNGAIKWLDKNRTGGGQ